MYPTQCRFMSVLDLLDCEDFSIHQFMVVERNLKAQRFFVTLSVKYGELRRFWNEIPLLTTKKTRKQRLQRQKTIKDQKKAKRRAVALRRASYRSKKKNTTSTRLPPTPEPTPLPMVQPPVPAPDLNAITSLLESQFNTLGENISRALRERTVPPAQPTLPDPKINSPARNRSPHRRRRHSPHRRSRSRSPHHKRSRSHHRRSRSPPYHRHNRSPHRRSHSPHHRRSRSPHHRHNHSPHHRHTRSPHRHNRHSPHSRTSNICYVPYPSFYPPPCHQFNLQPSSRMYNIINSTFDMVARPMNRYRYYDDL